MSVRVASISRECANSWFAVLSVCVCASECIILASSPTCLKWRNAPRAIPHIYSSNVYPELMKISRRTMELRWRVSKISQRSILIKFAAWVMANKGAHSHTHTALGLFCAGGCSLLSLTSGAFSLRRLCLPAAAETI
jgi:hypothetical protein